MPSTANEMGEYDSDVPGLYELLSKHAPEKEVFEYLCTVETESLGVVGDRQPTERFVKPPLRVAVVS